MGRAILVAHWGSETSWYGFGGSGSIRLNSKSLEEKLSVPLFFREVDWNCRAGLRSAMGFSFSLPK